MTQATRTAQNHPSRLNENPVINRPVNAPEPCNDFHPSPVLAWERRALQLAARRGYRPNEYTHWGDDHDGGAIILVRADTWDGHYRVHVHPIAHPVCDCKAGEHGQPCKHSGIALIEWATVQAARREQVRRPYDRAAYASEFDVNCAGQWC